MISEQTIVAFAVSAVCTLLVPIVLLTVLGIARKISALPLLLGAAAFFLSQIVLRIPLLGLLSAQGWYQTFSAMLLPYVLFLSLSAGLFEESARLGGAALLKGHRCFKGAVSFGLGHAFCEVILLAGLTHVSNLVLCVLANDAGGSLTGLLPAEALETAIAQLAAATPAQIYWGILERCSAVLFHIFATVLVFQGVISRQWRYYAIALAAHTVFNMMGVLTAIYAGIAVTEVALLIFALAAGYYTLRQRKTLDAAQ